LSFLKIIGVCLLEFFSISLSCRGFHWVLHPLFEIWFGGGVFPIVGHVLISVIIPFFEEVWLFLRCFMSCNGSWGSCYGFSVSCYGSIIGSFSFSIMTSSSVRFLGWSNSCFSSCNLCFCRCN
jgi:hypothetical protein